jgi:hypothetical protein
MSINVQAVIEKKTIYVYNFNKNFSGLIEYGKINDSEET